MEEIVIVEPAFLRQFQCVGNACVDHCCKGWEIELDRPSVTRYKESENIEIRNIASNNIIVTKSSHASWGKILPQSNGNCSFLDKDRLCKVHKSLGEQALSTTCSLYPRIYSSYKYEIRSNLTLSCPEATRLLLTSSDAMLYSEKVKQSAQALDAPEISQEDRLLNLMCTHIMKHCGLNIEERLYGVILLLQYREKELGKIDFNEKIFNFFESIQKGLKSGGMRNNMAQALPNYQLQSELLLHFQIYLGTKTQGRGGDVLRTYIQKLNQIHNDKNTSGEDAVYSFHRIVESWRDNIVPWLSDRPFLFSNYMQYRMYEDFFPMKKGRDPFSSLVYLTLEWFLLKWLVVATLDFHGFIDETDIVNIFYSYHSVTRHDNDSEDAFSLEIDKFKLDNGLTLLSILV